MESLPSSIEAYLSDAGFSGTEIVALKKLVEIDAATLRELAAKTGKSTGVLDQAMKKLMQKKVVSRETINEVPKYVIKSLNAILQWMEDDMHMRHQLMVRRHQDFESFIKSIVITKKRPEMEFFEGEEGVKKAYMTLLERGNDFIQYGPTLWIPDEDPLRDFRVEYFRRRHQQGIFLRAITHDTFKGRRMVSRDAFEYRRTILVDEDAYPFFFEKIIAGDTVACFHLEDNRACFIRFPEMAANERAFFDKLWNKKIQREQAANRPADPIVPDGVKQLPRNVVDVGLQSSISMKTRLLSELREFFLGKKSIAAFAACAVLAAGVTFGLYRYTIHQEIRQIQSQVRGIAATSALQFEVEDIEKIRTREDMVKPEYEKLVKMLQSIREENTNIKYAYLVRPGDKVFRMYYIADADGLHGSGVIDNNFDGVINEQDVPTYPGDFYDDEEGVEAAFEGPVAFGIYRDPLWGDTISGWAPIKDSQGKLVAIVGIDAYADEVASWIGDFYGPTLLFLCIFGIFVLIRLAAFNRSLFKEICNALSLKKLSLTLVGSAVIAIAATSLLYYYNVHLTIQRVQERVLSIAATGALQFELEDLNKIRTSADANTAEYSKVLYLMNEIRRQNPGVTYMYLMRPTKDVNTLEFIADADSEYPFRIVDFDNDGDTDEKDWLPRPGDPYDITGVIAMHTAVNGQNSVDAKPETDQWGTFISGYSPIKNPDGSVAAILGVDIETSSIGELAKKTFAPVLYFIGFFVVIVLIRLASLNRQLLHECYRFVNTRRKLIIAIVVTVAIVALTLIFYIYNVRANTQRLKEKILSIATTGSLQFNPQDLDELRTLQDTQKPVYQKIVQVLHNIREQNDGIMYVYLIRPHESTTTFEFIADADAYGIDVTKPFDLDSNGTIDDSDEVGYPGLPYDIAYIDVLADNKYLSPVVTDEPYFDKWGSGYSGYSPIRNSSGAIAGILAVDVSLDEVYKTSLIAFLPAIALGVGFMIYIIFIKSDFKKSVLYTFLQRIITRRRIYVLVLILMGVYWLLFGLYFYRRHLLLEETGKRLMAIAVTAASHINPDDLEPLRFARDMKREEYQRVFMLLNDIRKKNPEIRYAYIERATEQKDILEFVADADSNYYVPFLGLDYNQDNQLTDIDENVAPGVRIYAKGMEKAFREPDFDTDPQNNITQWGYLISGYAPIIDRNGNTIAILGLDVSGE